MSAQKKSPLVLVVDDEMSLRLSMRAALEKAGFQVAEAANGHEAIAAFQELRPALVLMDVMMPEMDGFEACAAIRDLPDGELTPMVMVTGLGDEDSTNRAFNAGATDFITKPFNWVMLGHRARYIHRASQAFKDLHKSRQRLAMAQLMAKLGNWEMDLADYRFDCSAEAAQLLELDCLAPVTDYEAFFETVHPEDRDYVLQTVSKAFKEQKHYNTTYRIVLADGEERIIINQGEPVFDEAIASKIMIGTVQDVTELKQAEEQARLLAFYDSLTGLANRSLLVERINAALSQARRSSGLVALLTLDLDRFKRINDTLGHDIGDLLLKSVADRINACVRASDSISRPGPDASEICVSRLGGDEFTILLAGISQPQDAALVAKRIKEAIPQPLSLKGHELFVTTSIGITLFPLDGDDADTLLKHADIAMYHAKERGRNNFQFYKDSLNAIAIDRLEMENDMRKALERNDEFQLHYQPQVDIKSGAIVGAEALIRWNHPKLGLVPPMKFIPMAEESGLIIPINEWVVGTACRQNKEWQKQGGKAIKMSVNLSGHQFNHQNIARTVGKALGDSGLAPQYLDLELTESIIMQKGEQTIATLKELKALGLKISIDDFGTGYSSLSYLTTFPVDALKIDRAFVLDMINHTSNMAIIKAIIAMGHSMDLYVIAEGVETEEQRAMLAELGCDAVQGYLFYRPMPADEFAKLLHKENSRRP